MTKIKTMAGLMGCALYLPLAQAGSLTVANSDLALAGGISAGSLYSDNTGGSNNSDTVVNDFLLELSAPADKGLGFVAAFGGLQQDTVLANVPADRSTATTAPEDIGLQYGWLTVKPTDGFTIDVGRLATKIGYEVANTYLNPHILIGGLWTAQPVYYPGLRTSFEVGSGSVFVESNEDTSTGATSGYVLGGNAALGPVNLSASYYNANEARDILDIIVSGEIAGIPVAANLDYHMIDSEVAIPGNDDSAVGMALYAKPGFGSYTVPVRFEYMDDGSSGVYGGMNSGYSFTVTPTYHYSENTFVRVELALVSGDDEIFSDEDGTAQGNKASAALQAGFLF